MNEMNLNMQKMQDLFDDKIKELMTERDLLYAEIDKKEDEQSFARMELM